MASYNRYHGNSGRITRVDERPVASASASPQPIRLSTPMPAPRYNSKPKPKPLPLLGGSLSELLPKSLGQLETEDIILLLILYLMYRESGDSELLIIMGAMFLL